MDDQGILPPEFDTAFGYGEVDQKEKKQLDAFTAGYVKACFGEVRQYDPRYQYFWERGYRVGKAICG